MKGGGGRVGGLRQWQDLMDWEDRAGIDAEADLHKVAGIPVQLSKDDTLGGCQRDPYLQQHQMHQESTST